MSGIISVFAWDRSAGSLTRLQDANTLAPDFIGFNDSAEIQIHPNGKFLYESNRRGQGPNWPGPDTIGVFAIDPVKGTLSEVEQVPAAGHTPRSFAIDPTGAFLFQAGQVSGNVALFRINAETGKLSPTNIILKIDVPVCIKFVPAHS
jgi:6-phosphogluconolactonase